MAKQIYIDENGNPIEVSGTINTAELLPISGNDTTDTKTYIDTGLSGKANTSDLATVATSGNYSDLNNIPRMLKCAYFNTTSGTTFDVPYADLKQASGRDYGIALVSAWKEIFALHWNNDNTIFISPITSGSNRTASVSWVSSTQVIRITFSASIYYGIGVYPM